MPSYQLGPFPQRVALIPGTIGYSFGKLTNQHDPGTRMSISAVAITSNVATLTVQILEGYIPAVGGLITVQGTQTATSGGAPNFNVTNVALAGVSINSTTGAGTVTFALTSSNIATTTDSGMAIVPAGVTADTLPGTAAAGQQFAVSPATNAVDNQRGITWFTQFTGSPSTVTMQLQGSDVDQDAYYTTIDQSTVATGESRSLSNVNYAFYRIKAASTGGTSPTVIAGIMVI